MQRKRLMVAAVSLALTVVSVAPPSTAKPAPSSVAARLADAYPQVEIVDSATIGFPDGTTMTIDDGKNWKSYDDQLNNADLVDQLSVPYPAGCPVRTPGKDEDPGRLRYDPFFAKIYGGSAKAVSKNLTAVAWFGAKMQVTKINDVDKRLAAVRDELKGHPEWERFLTTPGGGFNWRPIAKTNRRSVHSYGIAVDINVKLSDYWLNGGTYRNRIPCEIAEIFEAHGFIWGAKWFHFDTMHFEYRPELLG